MLGVDKMYKWSEKLGLALKSGIDLPNEVESIVPSTEWKQKKYNERWYPGETISVAIGQGQLSVTPMSMAVMMATVANGGTRVVPRLVKAYDEGKGWEPVHAAAVAVCAVPDEAGDDCRGARRPVARRQRRGHGRSRQGRRPRRRRQDRHGAGHFEPGQGTRARQDRPGPARSRLVRVHGAEGQSRSSPAWCSSEHGEHGYFSATVAKHIIETYFAQRDGLPLPVLPLPPPARRPPRRSASPRSPGAGGTH